MSIFRGYFLVLVLMCASVCQQDADPQESGKIDAPEAPRSSGKSGDKKSRRVSFAAGTAEEDGKMTGPRRSIGKKDNKKRNSISPAKKKETQKQREAEAAVGTGSIQLRSGYLL